MTAQADYRVQVAVKNNRILYFIENLGFKSVAQFCAQAGLQQGEVGKLINLQKAPLTQEGEWSVPARALADALYCEPDDLWSDEQRWMALATNRKAKVLSADQVRELLCGSKPLDELVLGEQVADRVCTAVSALRHPQSRDVLAMRAGLPPYERAYTLDEVGRKYGLTRERIRQIESRALRQLRHPNGGLQDLVMDEIRHPVLGCRLGPGGDRDGTE